MDRLKRGTKIKTKVMKGTILNPLTDVDGKIYGYRFTCKDPHQKQAFWVLVPIDCIEVDDDVDQ